MPQASPVLPLYADSFRCIGAACEDTCCEGWSVPIDQAAYEKYRNLPPSPLRTMIDASVLLTPKADAESEAGKKQVFAKIRMNDSNQCPLFTEGRLCRIQAELGEGLLSHACATYPRIVHAAGAVEEKSLTLSCPEAARLVLLTPELLAAGQPEEHPTGANEPTEELYPEGCGGFNPRIKPTEATRASAPEKDENSLPPNFWPIRKTVLALVQNRIYPLWQRLYLLN